MAGVTESNNWSPEVYRFETEDVVEGGEDGLDNLPGKQLAGRTNWLRLMITALCTAESVPVLNNETTQFLTALDSRIGNAISALIDSSPAALDTLNELAAALGDDPNFSTTITNALALKAPLASPALSGIPTAPTAALGTNNTQLANTAFVQAAIAAIAAFTKASAAEILAGTDDTKYVTSAGLLAGLLGAGGASANDYIVIPYRDKTTGVRKDLILQWGTATFADFAGTVAVAVTFPITFPNTVVNIFPIVALTGGFNTAVALNDSTITTSGFSSIVAEWAAVTQAGGKVRWWAIGN